MKSFVSTLYVGLCPYDKSLDFVPFLGEQIWNRFMKTKIYTLYVGLYPYDKSLPSFILIVSAFNLKKGYTGKTVQLKHSYSKN